MMTILDNIAEIIDEDHLWVICSVCRRLFATGSNHWFRHWETGKCHGKSFEAIYL